MNRTKAILKIILLSLIAIALLGLFWPFVIPGVFLWCIFRERYRDWMGALTALLIVLSGRFFSGEWLIRIGGKTSGDWLSELTSGILAWAIGSILVSAGYNIPRYFLAGLRDKEPPPTSINN